jgi:hypothetical protein
MGIKHSKINLEEPSNAYKKFRIDLKLVYLSFVFDYLDHTSLEPPAALDFHN